jgi:putative copper export protein/mono/diheme cytochrome c family protein
MDLLSAVRGVHMAATLSVAGALCFRLLIGPFALQRVLRPAIALAVLAGFAWLIVQSAALAGSTTPIAALQAVGVVLQDTRFGHVLGLRLILLGVVAGLGWRGEPGRRLALAAVVAAVCVVLQAALGHAAASGDPVLEVSLALHLLAAAAWLGGLLPLWLALRQPGAAVAARNFSLLGLLAVAVIAATALEQAAALFGGFPGLIGTPYGQVGLIKLAIFAVLLVLAAINRLVFTPALERSQIATRRMQGSILVEVGLGLMVVLAASTLASLEPGVHAEPVWPFPLRPSGAALADPDLAWEVVQGGLMLAAGVALAALGLVWRRRRWRAGAAVAVGAALAGFGLPHLRLLLVPATPTSFYTSPTGFDAIGIAHGAALYAQDCAGCHGAEGRGDGPLAKGMDIPPADLTAGHLWEHSDGELYWWLSHGMESPRGGLAMPGFGATLDDGQIWSLIDDIRAHNAGVAMAATGRWPHPVPAPGLEASCADGRTIQLSDLRGHLARVVAGPPVPSPLIATVFLNPGPPRPGTCVAAAPEVWAAYAVVDGVPASALAGTAFLIDGNGWLRERLLPGTPPLTAAAIAEAARRFAEEKLAAPRGGHQH